MMPPSHPAYLRDYTEVHYKLRRGYLAPRRRIEEIAVHAQIARGDKQRLYRIDAEAAALNYLLPVIALPEQSLRELIEPPRHPVQPDILCALKADRFVLYVSQLSVDDHPVIHVAVYPFAVPYGHKTVGQRYDRKQHRYHRMQSNDNSRVGHQTEQIRHYADKLREDLLRSAAVVPDRVERPLHLFLTRGGFDILIIGIHGLSAA